MLEALNWLTTQEWNAAYFLGLQLLVDGCSTGNVTQQILQGAERLRAFGYRFRHLEWERGAPQPGRSWERTGEHDVSCRQIWEDRFDLVGRARQARTWLAQLGAGESERWIARLLDLYDRNHPSPASALAAGF
jgi:hypothetical protein